MTREELIQALEKATGPSQKLDGDIAAHLKLHPPRWRRGTPAWASSSWYEPTEKGLPQRWDAPAFTGSLDAAMTLVPKGWGWMCGCAAGPWFFADLSELNDAPDANVKETKCDQAATPALALCIAALKAGDPSNAK